MTNIDLHIHSTYSDGNLSPEKIVSLASDIGISAIALTDHDTMGGVQTAMEHGRLNRVNIIAGIELSVWHHGRSIHILGYCLNPDHPLLNKGLRKIQQARKSRNQAILKKLGILGIPISPVELEQIAKEQVGRPHLARLLVQKKAVDNIDEAFSRFLGKKGKAYAPRQKFPAREAIDMITNAGGIAFLAHPGNLDPSLQRLPKLLNSLQDAGLAGLEAYHPSHTSFMASQLTTLARKRGMMVSCGTDFHADPSWESLLQGLLVPKDLQDKIMDEIVTKKSLLPHITPVAI